MRNIQWWSPQLITQLPNIAELHKEIVKIICITSKKGTHFWEFPLTLSFAGSSSIAAWMPYARKQRMAPVHNSMEKPPNICLQNFTHSGIVGGGVRALGPSRIRISAARAVVRPWWSHREDYGKSIKSNFIKENNIRRTYSAQVCTIFTVELFQSQFVIILKWILYRKNSALKTLWECIILKQNYK